jgi:hypothetical protein
MITRDKLVKVLTEAFPHFTPNCDDADLPYVVLGDFARFLLGLQASADEDQLRRAAELIETLYIQGDPYVKQATTIGLLEAIQNIWGHSGADPNRLPEDCCQNPDAGGILSTNSGERRFLTSEPTWRRLGDLVLHPMAAQCR